MHGPTSWAGKPIGLAAPAGSRGSPARAIGRTLALGVVILAGALGLGPLGGVEAVRAAMNPGHLATSATYEVRPTARLVHVSVTINATNPRRGSERVEAVLLRVHREAKAIRASAGGRSLRITTSVQGGSIEVRITLRSRLAFGQGATLQLEFDLPAGAPRSASPVRIGEAMIAFPARAFGDAGSVRVILPGGYAEEVRGGPLTRLGSDDPMILESGEIKEPARWSALIGADRTAALVEESLAVQLNGRPFTIAIRAWPEDASWATQLSGLIGRGLPPLVEMIGLAPPTSGRLVVRETSALLAGTPRFPVRGEADILLSERLDERTVLRTIALAWLDRGIFSEPWLIEGLASEYAVRTIVELGGRGVGPDAVTPSSAGSFALADWSSALAIRDAQAARRAAYGANASWLVARELLDGAGEAPIRAVLQAGARGEVAYPGAVDVATEGLPTDWRRLLDLLEERTAMTGVQELFGRWVLRPADRPLLPERSSARATYRALLGAGSGWSVPAPVRRAMGAWSFSEARTLMVMAGGLLTTRSRLETEATAAGTSLPASFQAAYEADLAAAEELADQLGRAIRELKLTAETLSRDQDPFQIIGLLGDVPPASHLERARGAFAAGRLPDALAEAGAATAQINEAAGRGVTRIVQGALTGLAAIGACFAILLAIRRRRRHVALQRFATSFAPLTSLPFDETLDGSDADGWPVSEPPRRRRKPRAPDGAVAVRAGPPGSTSPPRVDTNGTIEALSAPSEGAEHPAAGGRASRDGGSGPGPPSPGFDPSALPTPISAGPPPASFDVSALPGPATLRPTQRPASGVRGAARRRPSSAAPDGEVPPGS